MSTKRLLVVDDEPNIRRILQVAFDKIGYQTVLAEDVFGALQALERESFDCVLSDVTMPGRTGYELLESIKAKTPDLPVVLMTAFGTIPQAVSAIRNGAFEYVTKPFDLDSLKKVVTSAMAGGESAPSAKKGRKSAEAPSEAFLAYAPGMIEVRDLVEQVADSRATVMIGGESGVGKEVIARALHLQSSRAKKPFVAVSCAAIPETLIEAELFGYEKGAFTGAQAAKPGRFEMAHEGTLFLDEIGELPMATQVKLLRVLQEREFERLGSTKPTKVDVRVVTATHRDLRAAVEEGTFRLDLLYRLQVVEISVPALRDRKEDIVPLANLFLNRFARENTREALTVPEDVERALHAYSWPGNVRELENTMERATVLAPSSAASLSMSLLPANMRVAA